jgi:hypothetical protein
MSSKPEYKVGYKNPPPASQFKPGRSGNPKGRPKGSRNLDSLIREEVERSITIKEDGRTTKVPAMVVVVRQVTRQAAGGDLKAVDRLIALVRLSGIAGTASGDEAGAKIEFDPGQAERDQKLIDEFFQRLSTSTDTGGDQGDPGEGVSS